MGSSEMDVLSHAMANSLESLVNLLYLIEVDRDNPDLVLSYVLMSKGSIQSLIDTTRQIGLPA